MRGLLEDKDAELVQVREQAAKDEAELLRQLEVLQTQLEWQAAALESASKDLAAKSTTTVAAVATTPSEGVRALQAAVAPKATGNWKKVAACFAIAVIASASQNPGKHPSNPAIRNNPNTSANPTILLNSLNANHLSLPALLLC
jgi:hypothetical protein